MPGRAPNRYGPPLFCRHSFHSATIRSTSACVSGRSGFAGYCWRNFTEQSLRKLEKPACISELIDRASARAAGSWGQRPGLGNFSARYSQMASDSQMVSAPSISAGTRPLGEYFRMFCAVSGMSSPTTTSSNGAPVSRSASHGRSDHDEYFLFPSTIFNMASRSRRLW